MSVPGQGAFALRGRAANVVRSSTFRLALLYMALLGGSVAILLGFIYWSTAGYMDRQSAATIEAEIRGLAEQYQRRGAAGLTAVISERVARDPAGSSVYLLVDERLEPISGNLDRWPTGFPDENGWIRFRLRERGPDRAEEHAARGQVFLLRGGLRLLVGRDVRDLEATRALILDALAWGLAITAALALIGGWVMSAGVVRRLESINQTGREIMAGDLSRRIPSDGSGDDFDQLAVGLNRMLERIEALMAGVRQVSDNIAHDLRTPLTRVRTRLELLRAELDAVPTARRLADETIAETENVLATFNALLRIARIESGSRVADFERIDLSPLLHDLEELYEPLAAEKDQHLAAISAPGLWVTGDADLLFQALANLVDNAIKYTPTGGTIHLSGQRRGGQVELAVTDTGPGIPAHARTRVFDRFFRLDDSRSTPGSGLGLSLVKAILDLHRAEVELREGQPGLIVLMRFAAGGVSPAEATEQRPPAS
jgi:signal transduction histidine kinase